MQLPTETIEDSVDVLALEDIHVRYLDFNYENSKGHDIISSDYHHI